MIRLILGAAIALGTFFLPRAADAHSIYIFAFQDGQQICTNSYFGGKAKVKGGQVTMSATSGEILARALTDDLGDACFSFPDKAQDLVFTVDASGGHRAEFKLLTYDHLGNPSPTANNEATTDMRIETQESGCAGVITNLDLHQALTPIIQKLAKIESGQNSGANLKNTIGGLGWLMGFFGIISWASGRKKRKE